ncbi:hypothetical protein BBJ29_007278 [Phytophthora kernoviae]|uniref:glucan endo-1,3-beta-D-glucosidase n=1 Tax=Phytophthora kernoviae TaxID=325452 RepID=A0A3F2RW31_9STRA|nr:hypothetical protein BBP00_00003481 [Phytophthora kernoviae]RLN70984.1 hypothetical protein BBJ29_007278 [Phytophthora kernoviae]
MKFFVPTVAGVIAFSAQVNANGVCYDPNHGTGMTASSVAADMEIIAGKGFDSVRTYISKFGDVELGPIIAAAGLKVMLGVPYPQSDYQDQMAAAIKAAQSGGVSAIMVGNENLAGSCSPPSDMISVIQSIKSQVPGGVLVGSVQRNTEGIQCPGQSGWDELVSACDILGINAQPFFTPGTLANTAINVLSNQWQSMSGAYGDKLILTETGWPSSGSLLGNFGSTEGAEIFYNASEDYEQTFGIVTYDGQDKFAVSTTQVSTTIQQAGSVAQQTYEQTGSTVQQTYEQVTQTEAPTAAPTPEATLAPTPDATPAPTPEATPAQTPEATTAVPEPTQVPTETPDIYQSLGSADSNTTTGSNEIQFGSASTSGSVSGNEDEAGFASGNSTSTGSSESSDRKQQTQDSDESQQSQQTQQTINSIDSQAQQQSDNTQKINTQSGGGGVSASVALGVAGGACAVLMAFGFIYQARKRAAELEDADDKRDNFSVTPIQATCAL